VAQVDDAEEVAVGVGEDDEVRVLRVAVPVDPDGAEGDEAVGLRGLLTTVGDVQVQVRPRVRGRCGLAALQCQQRTRGAGGRGQYDVAATEAPRDELVAQGATPELGPTPDVADPEDNLAEGEHAWMVACPISGVGLRTVAAVILWLHGAFGAGKSSVAAELRRRRPDLVPYDPEVVGYLLRSALPVPTGDFQDLPEWRELVAATGAVLDADGRRTVVAPMSLLRRDHAREVFTGFADRGVHVVQVLLDVTEEELARRIAADRSAEHGDAIEGVRAWRQTHLPDWVAARSWLVPAVDRVVDTTDRTVAQVAEDVLVVLPA